ncbi:diaminopimelate epimerase [Candidatus Cyanaurora vandensis]|uniref:diaminopimelate epimerase n=1 Tax=Candidatus Cyanaurora vandensis TaxID=2714958 RepID=UPI002580CAE2|nr:diaminopimelate epimerase [Candidatus Cyanaurora vandensis]
MTTIPFVKYHGLGNDFVLIDNRHQPRLVLTPAQVSQVCDRHQGIGADGIIFLKTAPTPAESAAIVILNSDGSEAQMCGNGVRCLAHFMQDLKIPTQGGNYPLWTGAGRITLQLQADGTVTVDMGLPRLAAAQIPTTLSTEQVLEMPLEVADRTFIVTCVSMGNPHTIIFGETPRDWQQWGQRIEHHPYFPERTNVHFVQVIDEHTLNVQVWERGAGATLACGTGACAVLVAAILTGRAKSPARVHLPGGPLMISWTGENVWMQGPATRVFAGSFDLTTFIETPGIG